ncbi:MAG: HNH endonuclease, partial [SAR324 cluster bacterium]
RIKIDPGSKKTGVAIVNDRSGEVVFAAELEHRGQRIKSLLDSRRASRRSRRNRKTRYRKPRFLNRTRPKGWLAPSLLSRVFNIETWVKKLCCFALVKAISQELVRFDMQQMENPEISGKEYQQGTLAGYETKEYLLEKWNRTCVYCGAQNVPLEIEHIIPKSKGGSNRISNLTLACVPCNQKKGNQPVEEFLRGKPELLKRIKARAKAPLKDAAAVNATRWALFNRLKATGLPVEVGSGGLTNFNRTQQALEKSHWLDAACVGRSTPETLKTDQVHPLQIKAMGHGSRQMCRVNQFGFPRTSAKALKIVKGFQTGDMVKAIVTKGKKVGTYVGRVAVRSSGSFNIKTDSSTTQGISWRYCSKVHALDGYLYF